MMSIKHLDIKSPIKFTLSITLSGYAILMYAWNPTPSRLFCMLAMISSSIGDMFMMGQIRRRILPFSNFITGAIAFAIAHLFYSAAYGFRFYLDIGTRLCFNTGTGIGLLLFSILILVFWGICIWRKSYALFRVIPVYLCFIGIACCTIFTYTWAAIPYEKARAIGAAIGAISFLFSDCCIGLNRVAGLHWMGKLVWVFYPIGQFLLISCG